jgi:hypothetical protein
VGSKHLCVPLRSLRPRKPELNQTTTVRYTQTRVSIRVVPIKGTMSLFYFHTARLTPFAD